MKLKHETETRLKHELFSVWKENPVFTPSTPWKLQMPNGILSFRTKRKATAVADECKRRIVDGSYTPLIYPDSGEEA